MEAFTLATCIERFVERHASKDVLNVVSRVSENVPVKVQVTKRFWWQEFTERYVIKLPDITD